MKGSKLDAEVSRLIFGEPGTINMSGIERTLSLPRGCVRQYVQQPYKMPLGRFAAICQLLRVPEDQIQSALALYIETGAWK